MIHHPQPLKPRQDVWHRLDTGGRHAFPFVFTLALLLVLRVPLGLPAQPAIAAGLLLDVVLFWSLHRPAAMPPVAVFALGLLADLLGQGPIGITMLALLAAQAALLAWRRVLLRHDFLLHFLAASVIAALFAGLVYALTCLLGLVLLPPAPALIQAALAAGLYPLVALALLPAAHRGIADPDHAL